MIDYSDSRELLQLSEDLKTIVKEYNTALFESAKAKAKMDCLLAERIDKLLERKKNIGIEMAVILMISKEPLLGEFYAEKLRLEAEVKGLEATKEALQSQISLVQSLIKNSIRQT